MNLSGEHRIVAPRETVWAALNDPEVLRQAIPGCQEIEKESDTAFTAKVKAKVGPVSASFKGKVTLTDIDPPNGYRIAGEGQGGVAGFAKGGANVTLEADGAETILRYEADGQVGGKLAQVGARLVEGSARKVADDFFGRFNELVAASITADAAVVPIEASAPAAAASAPEAIASHPSGVPEYGPPFRLSFENLWFGLVALALLAMFVIGAGMQ